MHTHLDAKAMSLQLRVMEVIDRFGNRLRFGEHQRSVRTRQRTGLMVQWPSSGSKDPMCADRAACVRSPAQADGTSAKNRFPGSLDGAVCIGGVREADRV